MASCWRALTDGLSPLTVTKLTGIILVGISSDLGAPGFVLVWVRGTLYRSILGRITQRRSVPGAYPLLHFALELVKAFVYGISCLGNIIHVVLLLQLKCIVHDILAAVDIIPVKQHFHKSDKSLVSVLTLSKTQVTAPNTACTVSRTAW